MRHLPIRKRMAIILLAFLVPITVLASQLSMQLTSDIDFSEKQIKGIIYERPLLMLMNEIADHQIAVLRKQAGDASADKEIQAGAAAIDEAFMQLADADRRVGEALDFTEEGLKSHGAGGMSAANEQNKWQTIKNGPYKAELYTELLSNLARMIKHLGDTSNMILDPDLDSYYLVDVSLGVFPQALNKLADIKVTAYTLLHAYGALPAEKRSDFESEAHMIENSMLARTKESIETAFNEDANFNGASLSLKPTLEPALHKYEEAGKQLTAAMHDLAKGNPMTAEAFVDVADAMHDGTVVLAEDVLNELQKLIEARVNGLKQTRLYTLAGCGIAVLFAFVLFFIISGGISRPISLMTGAMEKLAGGDMSVTIPALGNRDEIGHMAKAVEVFKANMIETEKMRSEQEAMKANAEREKKAAMETLAANFERDVKSIVNLVAAAATELSQTAKGMTDNIRNSSKLAMNATNAASTTSANVQSVASAAEELSASVREISSQIQRTNHLVQESSGKAQNADRLAHDLSVASHKVNEVMSMISGIAGQINLLALNATIESARAGEAGKGFAVVASEVKSLANQTDKSVNEIQSVIEEMRTASDAITQALNDIKSSVSDISGATTTVASAVEEQSATTNEIARNMQTAAEGTQLISDNLGNVSASATESGTASEQMFQAAEELSRQAELLNTQVDAFLGRIRAA